jgi:hypothetical protein
MGRKEAKGGHGQSVPTSSAGTSPPSCPQGRSRTHIRGSRQRQGVALPVQACVRYALRWDACVRGKLRCKGSCEAEQVAGSTLYSRPSAAARSAMLVIARKSLLARTPLPGSRNLSFLLRENGRLSHFVSRKGRTRVSQQESCFLAHGRTFPPFAIIYGSSTDREPPPSATVSWALIIHDRKQGDKITSFPCGSRQQPRVTTELVRHKRKHKISAGGEGPAAAERSEEH